MGLLGCRLDFHERKKNAQGKDQKEAENPTMEVWSPIYSVPSKRPEPGFRFALVAKAHGRVPAGRGATREGLDLGQKASIGWSFWAVEGLGRYGCGSKTGTQNRTLVDGTNA